MQYSETGAMKVWAAVLAHAPELVAIAVGIALVCAPMLMRRRSAADHEKALFARRIRAIGMVIIALAAAWLAYTACRACLHRSGEVMHRVHAGARGTDGWIAATSTKGAFTVRLPAEFNDFSSAGRDNAGRFITTHALVATPGSNIVFAAQLILVTGPHSQEEQALRQFEADRVASAHAPMFRAFNHQGLPGLDSVDRLATPAGPATLFMRRVRATEGLYMLSVTCPTNHADMMRKPTAYFFESLRTR